MTLPQFVREGSVIGRNLGVQPIKDRLSQLEIRDEGSFALAEQLIQRFFKEDEEWKELGAQASEVHSTGGMGLSKLFWVNKDPSSIHLGS